MLSTSILANRETEKSPLEPPGIFASRSAELPEILTIVATM